MPEIGEIRPGAELGYKYWAKWQWCACPECGICRWTQLNKARSGKQLRCKACANTIRNKHKSHDRAPNWKGGRYREPNTHYVFLKVRPDDPMASMRGATGSVREHRLVVALHLGRPLLLTEHVHHKNGIKDDNRLQNLELTSPSQHILDHSRGYQDGYNKGYTDGVDCRIAELEQQVILLKERLSYEHPDSGS